MGTIYKLKPEIVGFIVAQKRKNPDLSCRKLVEIIHKKYSLKVSKSSINFVIKQEELSSPVGRRTKKLLDIQGEIEHGGFSLLQGIDYHFDLSKIMAEIFMSRSPGFPKELYFEVINVVQALTMFKAIFDLTIESTRCYDNGEIWALVGRRPTRSTYNKIMHAIESSQLTVDKAVTDIKRFLVPVSGIRFQLKDGTGFFVDAQLQSIWNTPAIRRKSFITYYKIMSYVNDFFEDGRMFSVFNIQGANIYSQEVLDFIAAMTAQNISKRIKQIEVLDLEGGVIMTKPISTSEKRFFFLGFWPWQLEGISEFERKPANKKLAWRDFGLEYYYQIEEVSLSQHLVAQEVKFSIILLKSEPAGAARMGILTNLPADNIPNHLSIKELYNWLSPEERYKKFVKWAKETALDFPAFLPASIEFSKVADRENYLENIFAVLSQILFYQFKQNFVPRDCSHWSVFKLKDVFLRQKATIRRSRDAVFHNILITNKLCNKDDLSFICKQLNQPFVLDPSVKIPRFTCTQKLP